VACVTDRRLLWVDLTLMGADFGGRAAMGCRWGVLSFKLKFNRTPMMLNINFNFNIYF